MKGKWDISKASGLVALALVLTVGFVLLRAGCREHRRPQAEKPPTTESGSLQAAASSTFADSLKWVALAWHNMEQKVLLGELPRDQAGELFASSDSLLRNLLRKHPHGAPDRCFPLPGYGPQDIGGVHGEGYIREGYDFFDGNRHGGHPAQDIFVRDRDQNCRDDLTGESIPVISVSSGLVVSVHVGWKEGSQVRGGNYVFIYDPWTNGYYYYAHLDSVEVTIGEIVSCREKIATVGRSGKNAYPKRSPTHLHLMYLASTPEGPVPRNLYNEVCTAKKVTESEIHPRDRASASTKLVDITEINPDILVDLKYSTEENFLHADLYGDLETCFLQSEVANMLSRAQEQLSLLKPGYRLIVYDCLRPRSVQREMWNLVKGTTKEPYVVSPEKGSMHNYGAAVDLSVVDERGNPLDMGTDFDHFGDLSQPKMERKFREKNKLSSEQIANRLLLRMVMVQAGFIWIDEEWWHFNADTRENIMKSYDMLE
jgi:D-alanyl-D-alanine dipeptidase